MDSNVRNKVTWLHTAPIWIKVTLNNNRVYVGYAVAQLVEALCYKPEAVTGIFH
jgi:hypothetical protein